MKSGKKVLFAIVGVIFLISACQDENGKEDYSGVSELISDRNKARYSVAERSSKKEVSSKKQPLDDKADLPASPSKPTKEDLTSVILYEEDIDIVGSKSGRRLAKGVAYVDKKGQIVRIKILKE